MKVDVFTLCDFASAERDKLTIVGAFTTIVAREAPIVRGLCAVAARIHFQRIEEGVKGVRLSIIDSDGKPVIPTLETQITTQFRQDGTNATALFVVVIQQIKLPSFGEYSIDLAIDGRHEASAPLTVKQAQAPASLPPPLPPASQA